MTLRPWKATLCLTYVCNLRCGFCRIWRRRPNDEFTLDEWKLLLARAPRFLWVDVTGGEPTMRADFHDLLDAIVEKHRPWLLHFPTNGSFPDRLGGLERFARKTRLVVTVSIDGPREVHDHMRGVPGSFDLAIESLKRLRKTRGVKAVAGMTLSAENEDAVDATVGDIRSRISDFEAGDLHMNLAQVSEHYYGNGESDFKPARSFPPSTVTLWPPTAAAESFLERRFHELVPDFLRSRRTPLPCRSMAASIFVSPNGLVYPCISDQRPVGNLREHDYDLRRLLDTDRASELRREIEGGSCAHCWTACEAFPTIIEHTFKPWLSAFADASAHEKASA